LDIQVYTMEALNRLSENTMAIREHVGWNFTATLPREKRSFYPAPLRFRLPKLGLTLDEIDDWHMINRLFCHFQQFRNEDIFGVEDVISFLGTHSGWITNQDVRRKEPPHAAP